MLGKNPRSFPFTSGEFEGCTSTLVWVLPSLDTAGGRLGAAALQLEILGMHAVSVVQGQVLVVSLRPPLSRERLPIPDRRTAFVARARLHTARSVPWRARHYPAGRGS